MQCLSVNQVAPLNSLNGAFEHRLRRSSSSSKLITLLVLALAICCLRTAIAQADATITSCTESSLDTALKAGGTVTFTCDGTITLTSTKVIALDVVLDATGHSITISGNGQMRVFTVNSGVNCTLRNLTITKGAAQDGFGGGIHNSGNLTIANCALLSNAALGANGVVGIDGSPGAEGDGGAYVGEAGGDGSAGTDGSQGSDGQDGLGGAIYNAAGSVLLTNCTFANNRAAGGYGGEGGNGGSGGAGGFGNDGSTTEGRGDSGGDGGYGGSGGNGSDGGNGGSGAGSAIYCDAGQVTLVNCTLAQNQSMSGATGQAGAGGQGGTGGVGGAGDPAGATGGDGEDGVAGSPGSAGSVGGAIATDTAAGATGSNILVQNTILANNLTLNGSGSITDGGHNISTDASCPFDSDKVSLNNTNPLLAPLANNGGPSETFGLYIGSPALDTADSTSCPPTDQRGIARPQGSGCDIGAFEGTVADRVPPVLTFITPAPSTSTFVTNLRVIAGTLTDDVGAKGLGPVLLTIQRASDHFYWNGSNWTAMPVSLAVTLGANGSWSRSSGNPAGLNLSSGRYILQASAVDAASNRGTTSINITVDIVAPTVQFTIPDNNYIHPRLSSIHLSATDNTGGSGLNLDPNSNPSPVQMSYQRNSDHKYWNGQAWSSTATRLAAHYDSSVKFWVINDALPSGSSLLDGQYTLQAFATDMTGNVGTTVAHFTIDSKIPVVTTITAPMLNATLAALPALSGIAQDNSGGSGIGQVDALLERLSDRKYWTGTAWSSAATWLTTILSGQGWSRRSGLPAGANLLNGRYQLVVRAYDRAGNARTAQETFTINHIAHSVSALMPSTAAANVLTSSVVLIFSGALDADLASDAAHYSVRVNGIEVVIESASYNSGHRSVRLSVGEGALSNGAQVKVGWHDLSDSRGNALDGQTTLTAH